MFEHPFVPLVVGATLLSVILIFFMACSLILLKKRQNRKSKEYLQSLLDEKEHTMHSISMELHDNVNQILNMTRMDIHMLEVTALPVDLPQVKQIGRNLDMLLIDTQNISHSLNPKYVQDIGFIPALQEKAEWLNKTNRIRCIVEVDGKRKILPDQTGLMVFRIAQEAIQNVLKYANAESLVFKLHFGETDFELRITDDGKGIDRSSVAYKKGAGIENLHQRAKIVNGHLEIFSEPGSGTSIVLNIPNAYVTPPALAMLEG